MDRLAAIAGVHLHDEVAQRRRAAPQRLAPVIRENHVPEAVLLQRCAQERVIRRIASSPSDLSCQPRGSAVLMWRMWAPFGGVPARPDRFGVTMSGPGSGFDGPSFGPGR